MQEGEGVIIVGAGPSGLAAAACLAQKSIPFIILEREDCYAAMWKKYSYDRLHLHLPKQYCELPLIPFPASFPPYVPKKQFIDYLDSYVSHFGITPLYHRTVKSAEYDGEAEKWNVKATNGISGEAELYTGRFLVIATGEATDPYIPNIEGLSGFSGEVLHSTQYKSGKEFKDKSVLVVGSGNSGMEIALDLANYGAKTSVAVRSPVHILSREIVSLGFVLFKYLSFSTVDTLMVILSKILYWGQTKYGIARPREGPFYLKDNYGKYPIIDAGTYSKIKSGEIQVISSEIETIRGNEVSFSNGKTYPFDAIVFCTGFKRSTNLWLKGDYELLKDDGIAKPNRPNYWKEKNGLYCVGLSRRGLYGANGDAQTVANDIISIL